MYCFKCGLKLEETAEFCSKCGVRQQNELSIDDLSSSDDERSIVSIFRAFSTTQKAWSIAGAILIALILISGISGGNSGLNIFGNGTLNRPAVDFVMPGDASVTLQQVWGVQLNTANGPVSLREMADQAFDYTSSSVGGGITKSQVEIAFQPGNSMYSFFNRLLSSQDAIDAVRKRWVSLAQ
jgi:hypothetical protein